MPYFDNLGCPWPYFYNLACIKSCLILVAWPFNLYDLNLCHLAIFCVIYLHGLMRTTCIFNQAEMISFDLHYPRGLSWRKKRCPAWPLQTPKLPAGLLIVMHTQSGFLFFPRFCDIYWSGLANMICLVLYHVFFSKSCHLHFQIAFILAFTWVIFDGKMYGSRACKFTRDIVCDLSCKSYLVDFYELLDISCAMT